jgi:hypothetical protein
MTNERFEILYDLLSYRLKGNQTRIDAFRKDFELNPLTALEWSQITFEAASQVRVLTIALKHLSDADGKPIQLKAVADFKFVDTVTNLRQVAESQVNTGARYPARSTSVTSCLVSQCLLQAWAELLNDLGNL